MQKLLLKPDLFRESITGGKDVTRRLGNLDVIKNPDRWSVLSVETIEKGWPFGGKEKNKVAATTGTYAFFQKVGKKSGKIYVNRVRARYHVGEVVYLAEPVYTKIRLRDVVDKTIVPYWYEYDVPESIRPEYKQKYHRVSSMFMNAFHARHFVKITKVRCERLQDITEREVMREGLRFAIGTGIITFSVLFDKINGIGNWKKNPYIWVYDFEYLKGYKRSDSAKA